MKAKLPIFLFILSFSFLPACSIPGIPPRCDASIVTTPHAFIATAFQLELDAVLDKHENPERCVFDGITYYSVDMDKENVLVFMTGVGPEKAINTTTKTLKNFEVNILLFSGIAGGISQNVRIGDTFIPQQWFDIQTGGFVSIDSDVLEIVNLIDSRSGIGASSDHFIEQPDEVRFIENEFGAAIVDMESFYIAKVAQELNVPFLAIRSVSDHATGERNRDHYNMAVNASVATAEEFLSVYFDLMKSNPLKVVPSR